MPGRARKARIRELAAPYGKHRTDACISQATLAAFVGVPVEVPVMLILVRIVNKIKGWF